MNRFLEKRYPILIGVMICLVGLSGLILFYSYLLKKEGAYPQETLPKDVSARGLSFAEYESNRKVFSFEIDTFEIYRKKIGFYRLGFFKVAKMKGVELNFYVNTQKVREDEKVPDIEKYLLKNNRIETLKLKKIKGIEIKDMAVNFFRNDKLMSSIKSRNAHIGIQKKEIIFKGKASIRAGEGKSLRCDRIKWMYRNNRLKTMDNYYLMKWGKVIAGKGLECDYLLEDIKFASPIKENRN